MSLFYDDFETIVSIPSDLTTAGWTTVNNPSSITVETSSPAEGLKSIKLEDAASLVRLLGSGNGPFSGRIEFWFRFSSLPASGSRTIARTYQGATANLALRLNSAGKLEITNASFGVLGTGLTTLSPNTWYHIEWRLVHDDYVLSNDVVLKVDETIDISLAEGLDTKSVSEASVDGFSLHGSGDAGIFYDFDAAELLEDDPTGVEQSSTSSSQSGNSSSSSISSASSTSTSSTSSSSQSGFSESSLSSQSSTSVSSYSNSSSSSSSSTSSSDSASSASSSSQSLSSTSSSSGTSSTSLSSDSSSVSTQSFTSLSSKSSQSDSTSSSLSSLSSASSLSSTTVQLGTVISSTTTSEDSSQSSSSISTSSSSSSSSVSSSGLFGRNLYLCGDTEELFLQAWRRRDSVYSVQLLDAAGKSIVIDASNVVLFKFGMDNMKPYLEVHSRNQTLNGSWASATNPTLLSLDKDDLIFPAGIYDLEIVILDDYTGSVITTLDKGIFALHETQRGIMGL